MDGNFPEGKAVQPGFFAGATVGVAGLTLLEALANRVPDLLEVANVRKAFPGVLALDDVSFRLKRGHVHALMG